MLFPDYWLARPKVDLPSERDLEPLYQAALSAEGGWLEPPPDLPKWAFLTWLAEEKELLLHGSGVPDLTLFEPRTPKDRSPDDFSKQIAVFAASDGIWAIVYAVLDRANYPLGFSNGALQRQLPGGLTDMHYYFSVTAPELQQRPWREGTVYLLPKDRFVQMPPYELGALGTILEPHWASSEAVRPAAKLRVSPEDFPFLQQVRSHDDATVQARVARDPEGFPWLEELS